MKKLIVSASIMGISTVVSLIVGVLRSKVMATFLGPQGVGIFSQAFSFFTAASTVASLGLGAGIIRYICRYKEQKKNSLIKHTIISSFILQMFVCALWMIIVVIFANKISLIIFSTSIYSSLLIFIALAIPLTTLVYLIGSIFLSLDNVKAFASSRIWGYLIGIAPMFLLVYFWGVKGSIVQIFLVAFISCSFCLYYFIRLIPTKYYLPKHIFELAGSFSTGTRVFRYGLVMLINTALTSLSILTVRSLIIHRLGIAANGYYQVLVAFSAYHLPFFTNVIWSHLYPCISSSTRSSSEINKELNNTVRFFAIGITSVIVFILLTKRFLVPLLFSHKFTTAIPLMETQLAGNFFALFSLLLASSVLAKGRIRMYLYNGLFVNFAFIALSLGMLGRLKISAVPLAYAIAQVISVVLIYIYQTRYLKLVLNDSSLKVILASLVLLVFISSIPSDDSIFYLKFLSFPLWLWIVIKKSEWQAFMKLVVNKSPFCISFNYD
jgi:PST family polysaccharide transporter